MDVDVGFETIKHLDEDDAGGACVESVPDFLFVLLQGGDFLVEVVVSLLLNLLNL